MFFMSLLPGRTEYGDALATVRLLSNTTIDCLKNPDSASEHLDELNKIYWFLRTYSEGILRSDSEMSPLHRTLERTVLETFPSVGDKEAVEIIVNVLGHTAYPTKYPEPNQEELDKTKSFLTF